MRTMVDQQQYAAPFLEDRPLLSLDLPVYLMKSCSSCHKPTGSQNWLKEGKNFKPLELNLFGLTLDIRVFRGITPKPQVQTQPQPQHLRYSSPLSNLLKPRIAL